MGFKDKVEHKAQEAKGKTKERYGDATDDERLQAEGQAEKGGAHVQQAGDHVKDAASQAKNALRD